MTEKVQILSLEKKRGLAMGGDYNTYNGGGEMRRNAANKLIKHLQRHTSWYTTLLLLVLVLVCSQLGLWGLLVFVLALVAWRFYKGRAMVWQTMYHVEAMLWGKPLHAELWQAGELRRVSQKRRMWKVWVALCIVFAAFIAIMAALGYGMLALYRWAGS